MIFLPSKFPIPLTLSNVKLGRLRQRIFFFAPVPACGPNRNILVQSRTIEPAKKHHVGAGLKPAPTQCLIMITALLKRYNAYLLFCYNIISLISYKFISFIKLIHTYADNMYIDLLLVKAKTINY